MDIKGIFGGLLSAIGDVVPGVGGFLKTAGKALQDAEVTPEQEAQLQKQVQDFSLSLFDKEISEKANARAREIEIARTGKKDKVVQIIALTTIGAFFGLVGIIFFKDLGAMSKEQYALVGAMVGYIAANANTVYGYYFGSSSSSKSKDETISKMMQ